MQDGCIFRVHLVVWKPLELLNELFVDLKNTAAILDRSSLPKQRLSEQQSATASCTLLRTRRPMEKNRLNGALWNSLENFDTRRIQSHVQAEQHE